jgi:hypothetical protein
MVEAAPDEVEAFLRHLYRKGVMLWSEGDSVRFAGPKGALQASDIATLKRFRPLLPALLNQSAPVSFSQLAQWNREDLARRSGVRSIACATHLSGKLDIDSLCVSIHETAVRHEALRTQIAVRDGDLLQVIRAAPPEALLANIRTPVRCGSTAGILELLRGMILTPVDVAADPLFAAVLFELPDAQYILVLTAEHIISDNVSKHVVLKDVLYAYARLSSQQALMWPERALQFPDYARAQRANHQSWLQQHGPYWEQHMQGCERTRFPADVGGGSSSRSGWGTAKIHVDEQLERKLRSWCREQGTSLPMAAFTAYVALVLRWCGVRQTVVQFETDGRSTPASRTAVGSFASGLYLRVTLGEDDDFLTLLERTTEEFCHAYEHQDSYYMASQQHPPGWTRNTVLNWMQAGPEGGIAGAGATALLTQPLEYPNPWLENLTWDHEPATALYEGPTGITGSVHFANAEHSCAAMERFARAFLFLVGELVSRSRTRLVSIRLPQE